MAFSCVLSAVLSLDPQSLFSFAIRPSRPQSSAQRACTHNPNPQTPKHSNPCGECPRRGCLTTGFFAAIAAVTLSLFFAFSFLRLVCSKGMWYNTIVFCRKTGNRSIREGTAKDGAIRRRPARDSLGHASRLDRKRTDMPFLPFSATPM